MKQVIFSNFLFVYGTLRSDVKHPIADCLKQQANWIGPASYQGKLYQIADYPAAVASSNPSDKVYGEVYQLFNADLWSTLDDYEECSPSFPEPTEYLRTLQMVYLANGQALEAWLYLYNRPVNTLKVIESGDFLNQGLNHSIIGHGL
ncbi:MAG: hypothetical protein RLZ92_2075 [Pseudomonadota bacterium]